MLQPTENFTADQIRFLQNEATEWINYVNEKIIEAASEGKNEVYIDIHAHPIGKKYWEAPGVLIDHFKKRGFAHQYNGQCTTIFKWEKEIEEQRKFVRINSLPDQFEFNGERVDGNGLVQKLRNFIFGEGGKRD